MVAQETLNLLETDIECFWLQSEICCIPIPKPCFSENKINIENKSINQYSKFQLIEQL